MGACWVYICNYINWSYTIISYTCSFFLAILVSSFSGYMLEDARSCSCEQSLWHKWLEMDGGSQIVDRWLICNLICDIWQSLAIYLFGCAKYGQVGHFWLRAPFWILFFLSLSRWIRRINSTILSKGHTSTLWLGKCLPRRAGRAMGGKTQAGK